MEIQRRLEGWKLKLEEAEEKYTKLAVPSCKPRAKRPKMSKGETWSQLADYTAKVVFEFFLKVIEHVNLHTIGAMLACHFQGFHGVYNKNIT